MGWLSFSMHEPVKEWFLDNWSENKDCEVLDVAIVKRTTLYAAIRYKKTGEVFAAIYLLRWSPKSCDNFAYKAMDESVGPCEIECPKRIFKLLTPTDKPYAIEWRKKVEQFHKTRDMLKKPNTIVKFDEPIGFTDGQEYDMFKKENRRTYAMKKLNGRLTVCCRVRVNLPQRMRNSKYELIESNI